MYIIRMESHIYNVCLNGVGTTIVIGAGLEKYNNNSVGLLDHIIKKVFEAVKMSSEGRGDVHIYLGGIEFMKFTGSFVRKVSRGLKKALIDTLGECIIYDLSLSGRRVWKCVKYFVDDETKSRIRLKKTEDIKDEQSV